MTWTFSHCPADHIQDDGRNGCEGCPAICDANGQAKADHCEAVFSRGGQEPDLGGVKLPAAPPDRIRCVVIGCRRTASADKGFSEMICCIHWRNTDAHLKRRYGKLKRLIAKADRLGRSGVANYFAHKRRQVWEDLKRNAIERAMGITA